MFFMIIYLLGALAGILCAIDIFQRRDLNIFQKLGLSLLLILLSWIGVIYYFFVLRVLMTRRHSIKTN